MNSESNYKGVKFGFSDEPIDTDSLGCSRYYEGLEKFIRNCPTPMTVAIQGGWGTGKSTVMKIIQKGLGEDVHVIEFNTWKYSKSAGRSLIVPLLLEFLKMVDRIGEKNPIYKEQFLGEKRDGKLLNGIFGLGGLAIGAAVEFGEPWVQALASIFGHVVPSINSSEKKEKNKPQYEELCEGYNIHDEIYKGLTERIEVLKEKKFVFFIDDLDRLIPEDAVNLLEDMKNVLSLENCVFVLALDNEIVQKGLSKKYGENVEIQYAERFFDKIIQLPFNLPINNYDIKNYVEGLNAICPVIPHDKIDDIVDLLNCAGVVNPRTIKRLLNILQLYNNVKDESGNQIKYDENLKEIFTIILIQISHKNIYDSICQNVKKYMTERTPFAYLEEKWEKMANSDDVFWENHFEDADNPLVNKLPDIFDHDILRLGKVLSMTTVTGDGDYGSIQEEVEDIYIKLTEYAKKIYEHDGWETCEHDDTTIFKKDDHTTVRIVNYGHHVSLNFFGKHNSVKLLMVTADGKVDKEWIKGQYYFDVYETAKGDIGIPYIMVFRKTNEDDFYLTRISTKNLESLRIAGKLLRENLK